MADSRQVDCFGESCASPSNDEVEPLESSLRDSTRSVESWQSTKDSQATFRANEVDLSNICAEILARIAKNSHIIFLLQGDIGAGKTTLVKAFAKQVGISDSVTSPTFSLLHIYGSDNSVLGMQFRTCENFGESTDSSLVLSPKFSQIQKPYRNHFDCDSLRKSTTNQTQNAESAPKIYHYDLFNRNLGELLDLGLLDLLEQRGIHFVEWGDSQLFGILKNAFENICIISIHKTKNDRIYEFKESF